MEWVKSLRGKYIHCNLCTSICFFNERLTHPIVTRYNNIDTGSVEKATVR